MSYAQMPRRKRISVEKMRWHIRLLCKEARIERRWCRRGNAHISFDGRGAKGTIAVHLPPIRGAYDYAVALHELGHYYGRYQLPRYTTGISEFWAWEWAQENALTWTARMSDSRVDSEFSYDWRPEVGRRIFRLLARRLRARERSMKRGRRR